MAIRVEYQLTLDDYSQACDAFNTGLRNRGDEKKTSWRTLLLLAASMIVVCVGLYFRAAARDRVELKWDPEAIAESIVIPAPWIILIVMSSSYQLLGQSRRWVRKGALLLIGAVGLLTVGFLAEYHSMHGMLWLGWYWIAIVYVSFWRNLIMRTGYQFAWKLQEHLQEPQVITLDDEGFEVASSGSILRYFWHAAKSWQESADVFILYVSGAAFHIIPKRSIGSIGEVDALRTMLAQRTGKPLAAFPVIFPMQSGDA